MKKLLLLGIMLLGMGGVKAQETEIEYLPGDPISLESIVSESTLVSIATTDMAILYGNNKDNQIYCGAINNAISAAGTSGSYHFKITEATDDGLVKPTGVTTLYRFQAFKNDGTSIYTGPWYGGNCYLNDIGWTRNVVPLGDEGEDGCFFGIAPIAEKENTYKITSYKKDGTIVAENIYGKNEWVFYVVQEQSVPIKRVVEANDEIFAMSKFSEGKWTLAPTSLYDWNYLVIGTENTAANGSHEIKITDNNGKTIGGNAYNGQAAGTGAGMWLDYWNSQNIIAIDLNQLRIANGLDIFNIVSLEITGDIKPSVVYLTDYANPKWINRGRYDLYTTGDVVREYTETGKFGTICLPYKASYAGAEIYSIAEANAAGITLEKVTGLLEAGKPYFYMASDVNGQNNEGNVRNVHFFRADFDTYDVAKPIENNGLIGTFEATTAPQGANYYVLSNNKLYYTTDATVNVGANKAYIDKTKIVNKGGGEAKAFIDFDEPEATGINAVATAETLKGGKFYDLSGREVANPTRGLYIVNGKKVLIK